MSWRRLKVILDHLPPESAYRTATRNGTDLSALPAPEPGVFQHGPWSQEDLLLAGIFDRLGALMWMQTDGKKPPPPPYPRPGVVDNVKPINAAAVAYLRYLEENHGAAPPEGWEAPEVV